MHQSAIPFPVLLCKVSKVSTSWLTLCGRRSQPGAKGFDSRLSKRRQKTSAANSNSFIFLYRFFNSCSLPAYAAATIDGRENASPQITEDEAG